MLAKQDITATLAEHRAEIQSCGVSRFGLFGSLVRGEERETSDIDLLVDFAAGKKKSFDGFMRLAFLLEDLFPRRVGLVTAESLSPYIRPHVLAEVEYVHLAPERLIRTPASSCPPCQGGRKIPNCLTATSNRPH